MEVKSVKSEKRALNVNVKPVKKVTMDQKKDFVLLNARTTVKYKGVPIIILVKIVV